MDASTPDERPGAPGGAVLSGRTPRAVDAIEGWPGVLAGLLVLGTGLAAGAVVARTVDILGQGRLAAWPFVLLTLALFAMAGLSTVVRGVRSLTRRRRTAALHARYPGQPWMVDHRWDREGGRDEASDGVGRALSGAVGMALCLVPFHWFAFWSAARPPVIRIVALLLDLVVLGLVGRAIYLAVRRLRYGVSRIAFASFPVRPGTTAELLLDDVSPRARTHPLQATLRCIEERYEVRGTVQNRRRVTVCVERWRDDVAVAPGADRVRFAIPEGLPTTALDAQPPRYWELELRAELPGVDYRARFLVPVYE